MGAIFTIAKRDFLAFFRSIKGSAVFWFFLLFLGVFFHSFIFTFVELEKKAGAMGGEIPTLEQLIAAIFNNINFILLLVIPAVTMATFSEEKKNKVIKLLEASPVSATQIVLGKFFAGIGMMLIVLISSMVFPLYLVRYGNPDIGVLISSYLGIFLLICFQISFGIWVSSMTKNQFISFLFTMFGLFLLLILNWIAPNITSREGTEGIVRYLASTTHLESFFKGMINVSDVVYFIIFTLMFLFLTNVVLDSRRWR
ncbi:MAG: ABC transporter permease [Oligoflexales bacterium]|nr:ABC transporter permease [Oligoflexales bacterium]